jgi:hypothetical protein
MEFGGFFEPRSLLFGEAITMGSILFHPWGGISTSRFACAGSPGDFWIRMNPFRARLEAVEAKLDRDALRFCGDAWNFEINGDSRFTSIYIMVY